MWHVREAYRVLAVLCRAHLQSFRRVRLSAGQPAGASAAHLSRMPAALWLPVMMIKLIELQRKLASCPDFWGSEGEAGRQERPVRVADMPAMHLLMPCTENEHDASLLICKSFGWCWVALFSQLALGIGLLVYLRFLPETWRYEDEARHSKQFTRLPDAASEPLSDAKTRPVSLLHAKHKTAFFNTRQLEGKGVELLTLHERQMNEKYRDYISALRSEPVFTKHRREFADFVRSNSDPELSRPPPYPTERWTNDLTNRWTMYRYLFLFQLRDEFLRAAAWALLASSFTTLLHMLLERERFDALGVEPVFAALLAAARETIGDAQSLFKFYPIFLLQGYVGYAVVRWREFVQIGYRIQGRIHDVALICGGALARPHEDASKQLAFRLYRYLNLAHFLCYATKHEWFKRLETLSTCVRLGLLTEAERAYLGPMANKQRDTVLGWLSAEIQSGVRNGLLDSTCAVTVRRRQCKPRCA